MIEIEQQDEISVFPCINTRLDLNYMVSNNLLPSDDKRRCIDPNIAHNLSVKVFESSKLFSFHGTCKREYILYLIYFI